MKKICEVLIRTGKGKFIPIGTAKIKLHFDWHSIMKEEQLSKVELEDIMISIKKEDILWEASPNIWVNK